MGTLRKLAPGIAAVSTAMLAGQVFSEMNQGHLGPWFGVVATVALVAVVITAVLLVVGVAPLRRRRS
jgi:Mn2+/Fe2+ NRAMP family transporter